MELGTNTISQEVSLVISLCWIYFSQLALAGKVEIPARVAKGEK